MKPKKILISLLILTIMLSQVVQADELSQDSAQDSTNESNQTENESPVVESNNDTELPTTETDDTVATENNENPPPSDNPNQDPELINTLTEIFDNTTQITSQDNELTFEELLDAKANQIDFNLNGTFNDSIDNTTASEIEPEPQNPYDVILPEIGFYTNLIQIPLTSAEKNEGYIFLDGNQYPTLDLEIVTIFLDDDEIDDSIKDKLNEYLETILTDSILTDLPKDNKFIFKTVNFNEDNFYINYAHYYKDLPVQESAVSLVVSSEGVPTAVNFNLKLAATIQVESLLTDSDFIKENLEIIQDDFKIENQEDIGINLFINKNKQDLNVYTPAFVYNKEFKNGIKKYKIDLADFDNIDDKKTKIKPELLDSTEYYFEEETIESDTNPSADTATPTEDTSSAIDVTTAPDTVIEADAEVEPIETPVIPEPNTEVLIEHAVTEIANDTFIDLIDQVVQENPNNSLFQFLGPILNGLEIKYQPLKFIKVLFDGGTEFTTDMQGQIQTDNTLGPNYIKFDNPFFSLKLGDNKEIISYLASLIPNSYGGKTFEPNNPMPEVTSAWNYLTDFTQYLENDLNFSSKNKANVIINSFLAEQKFKGCRSFYSTFNFEVHLGSGSGCTHTPMAYSQDVVIHEFMHFVTTQLHQIPNKPGTESAAINEAVSDYFATSFTDNSLFGENFLTNPRDLSVNKNYTDFGTNDHKNSLILSSTLWDLREQLGKEYTDRLIFDTLSAGRSTFENFMYQLIIEDDQDDVLLNGTPNISIILEIFNTHGIGNGTAILDNFILLPPEPLLEEEAVYYAEYLTFDLSSNNVNLALSQDRTNHGAAFNVTIDTSAQGGFIVYMQPSSALGLHNAATDTYIPFVPSSHTPADSSENGFGIYISTVSQDVLIDEGFDNNSTDDTALQDGYNRLVYMDTLPGESKSTSIGFYSYTSVLTPMGNYNLDLTLSAVATF